MVATSMVVRRVILLPLMLAAACGPGELVPDGGGDDVDADVPMGGLALRWSAPAVGASIDDVVIDEVRLNLRDVRAVGDAAGDLTYRSTAEIVLDGGGEPSIEFAAAPPGRYSAVEFRIAGPVGDDQAWRMRGECEIEGDDYELEIEDDEPSSISLPLDLQLAPGDSAVITIELDLVAVLDAVDFSELEPEGDRVTIDDESDLLDELRERLVGAFSIAGVE